MKQYCGPEFGREAEKTGKQFTEEDYSLNKSGLFHK